LQIQPNDLGLLSGHGWIRPAIAGQWREHSRVVNPKSDRCGVGIKGIKIVSQFESAAVFPIQKWNFTPAPDSVKGFYLETTTQKETKSTPITTLRIPGSTYTLNFKDQDHTWNFMATRTRARERTSEWQDNCTKTRWAQTKLALKVHCIGCTAADPSLFVICFYPRIVASEA
jgi:hypothetical protein